MENIDPQKMRLLILAAVGICIVSPMINSIVAPLAFFLLAVRFLYDSRAAQNQNRSGPRARIVPRQNAQKTVKYKQTTRHQHPHQQQHHHLESLKRPNQLVIQDHSGHDTDSVNSFDAADELLSLCRLDHRANTEDVDDVFLNSTSNECSTSKSRLHPFSEASNSSCLKVSGVSRSRSASNSSRRSRRARNTHNNESNKDHKQNTTPKTLLLTTDDSLKRLLSTWAEEQIRQFQDEIDDTQKYENDLFLSDEEIQLYKNSHWQAPTRCSTQAQLQTAS